MTEPTGQNQPDALAGGFYTVQEAARILRIPSVRRIRGWVAGYERGGRPVLSVDHEPVAGRVALSFWDLIEVRFLEYFRAAGVPLQTLRKIAIRARKELGTSHPFAISNARFVSDRKHVFAVVAEEEHDTTTLNMATSQFEMYETIEQSLAKGVVFDPASGLAQQFQPLPEYTNIYVHPRMAFGHPVIGSKGIPTAALLRMWKAEDGNTDRVARMFDTTPDAVMEAVAFERALALAA
jgi:uncharacterized protein (DUF433 family)